jgi:PAS domain S-box-containing protein
VIPEQHSRARIDKRLVDWLINPLIALDEPARQRARALAAITLIFIGLIFIVGTVRTVFVEGAIASSYPEIGYFPLAIILAILYLLARTIYHQLVIGLFLTAIIMILAMLATPSLGIGELRPLYFLVIPLILAALLLPLYAAFAMAAGTLVITLALPLMLFDMPVLTVINGPFALLLITTITLLVMIAFGQQLPVDIARSPGGTAHFRRLAEFSPDMIAIQSQGRYVYINPAGLKLLGVTSLEEAARRHSLLFDPEREETRTAQVIRSRDGDRFALRVIDQLQRADGSMLTVQITAAPVMYQNRLAYQLLVRDITRSQQSDQALRESEERYRQISELMWEYAYALKRTPDGQFHLEWVRGALEKITGYTADQLTEAEMRWKMIHPEDVSIIRQHLRTILSGEMDTSEFRIITRTGTVRHVRDYGRPLWDDDHEVNGIYGIVQDITDQFQAEMALKTHALQQAVVAGLGLRALSKETDLSLLMREVVTLTAQVLDVEYCLLFELSPDGSTLHCKAWLGWDEEALASLIVDAGLPHSQSAYTLIRSEPVIVEDLPTEERFTPLDILCEAEVRSGVSVLIQAQGRSVGVLEAHTTLTRSFTPDDVNFMQSMANVLAAFFERQRFEIAEREQRTLAEALRDTAAVLNSTLELNEVLDRMLAHVSQVVPHDAATIMLVDDNGVARIIREIGFSQRGTMMEELNQVTFIVTSDKLLVQMTETSQPIALPDVRQSPLWRSFPFTDWIRSYVGAPIMFQGQILGIINVDSATPYKFNEVHAQRLQAFANQASIAIRNARRATELEQRVADRTAELELERRRLQTVLDATGEGIFYSEGDTIRYTNQALCEMLGWNAHELAGQPAHLLFNGQRDCEDNKEMWRLLQDAVRENGVWRHEYKLKHKDGGLFDASLTISLAEIVNEVPLTVTLVRDVSNEKQLEAQKSRFIASASHELRSPVSSLNTRLYIMKREPDRIQQHIDLLERSVDRMNRLIEDLLDLSRFENGVINLRQRNVVLESLVIEVVETYQAEAESKNIKLTCNLSAEPQRVFVDPDRIIQVLTNLLTNAITYTHDGGHIQLEVTSQHKPETGESFAAIHVIDNGYGIPPDMLPHIFQPFYRAEDSLIKGTGLGLSIVREIVHAHNGRVDVHSTLDQGSTFTVYLPLLPVSTP